MLNPNDKGHHGRGDRQGQNKRRKINHKVRLLDEPHEMIDGNFTRRPVAYCTFYKGYLTKNMSDRHKCECRNCPRYKKMDDL